MRQQLEDMLSHQVAFNQGIYADWHERDLDWKAAVFSKCPALMVGSWEWWVANKDSWSSQIAAVDICCSLLGWLYVKHSGDVDSVMLEMISGLSRPAIKSKNLVHVVQSFAAHTLVNEAPSIPLFGSVLLAMNLTVEGLYVLHSGKIILNKFRQDNGYREGGYQEVWGGIADIDHLKNAVSDLPESMTDFQSVIYRRLDNLYRSHVIGAVL